MPRFVGPVGAARRYFANKRESREAQRMHAALHLQARVGTFHHVTCKSKRRSIDDSRGPYGVTT